MPIKSQYGNHCEMLLTKFEQKNKLQMVPFLVHNKATLLPCYFMPVFAVLMSTLHWKDLLRLQLLQVFLSVKIFFFFFFFFRRTGTETSFKSFFLISCSQYASNESVKTQKVYNVHDKTYTCVKNAADLDKTIA